jgi:hypothetical protein
MIALLDLQERMIALCNGRFSAQVSTANGGLAVNLVESAIDAMANR